MVEKLLDFYNNESMYNNYIKKFSLLILFLLIFVLSIIVFFNIIFWIKQLSINYFYFHTIIFLLFLIIIILCIIKFEKEFLKKNNISSFKNLHNHCFQVDKIKIKKFLIDNNIYNKDKINVLIKEINYYNNIQKKNEGDITLIFFLTNIISTGFYIINYRDANNSINYIEAFNKAIIIYIVVALIYIVIKIIFNDIEFFKQLYRDLTNKSNEYERLIHILNDIVLTENLDEKNISIIKNIKNVILNKINSIMQ